MRLQLRHADYLVSLYTGSASKKRLATTPSVKEV